MLISQTKENYQNKEFTIFHGKGVQSRFIYNVQGNIQPHQNPKKVSLIASFMLFEMKAIKAQFSDGTAVSNWLLQSISPKLRIPFIIAVLLKTQASAV